jgi:hypothetical protein
MQRLLGVAATAFEQSGCPLGGDGDLVLFGDGMSFVVVPIPDYGDRTFDRPLQISKTHCTSGHSVSAHRAQG